MAHLRVDFFSDTLALSTSMTVLLPQRTTMQVGMSGAATHAPRRHAAGAPQLLRRRALPVTTSFGPGEHDWAYWDARIQDVLAWLPLAR